jgi:uncharacterized protein YxjI
MGNVAEGPAGRARTRTKPKRPPWLVVVFVGLFVGVGRELIEYRFGIGVALVAVLVFVLVFRAFVVWGRSRGRDIDTSPERIAAVVRNSAVEEPAFAGDGTLGGAPIIVIAQRTKAFEAVTEYGAFDEGGGVLATVRQVGQSRTKRFFRLVTGFDIFFTHRFEVRDRNGTLLGTLTRPRKFFISRVEVAGPAGEPVALIRQLNVFGHIRFSLRDAYGYEHGLLRARGWRAWDFDITARSGEPVAEVIKAWEGFTRTVLTTADRYVLRVARPLDEPLRTLVVTAALAIDVALKQDNRMIF